MNVQNEASFTAVNNEDQAVYDDDAKAHELNDALLKGGINGELMCRKITLAFGKAADTPQGKWKNLTCNVADLIEFLSTFRKGVKDGKCMMQGEVIDGKRTKSSIQKLHVMMFDHDTGALTFDQVRDKIINAGLWAMIWSTHSSGKPVTVLKTQAVVNYAKLKARKDITAEHACDYLKQVKGYANWVLEGATISKSENFTITVKHKPLEKFRTLHILSEPFVLDDNKFGTAQDAQNSWKKCIENVAHMLDATQYDKSCTDTSRLMYTPARAIKSNADDFRIEVINGDFLDLSKVDEAPVGIVEQIHQKFAGGTGDGEFKTDNLKMFAAKHGRMFDAARWLEEEEPDNVIDQRGDGGIHFRCPNEDNHTVVTDDDKACMVTNGSDSDGSGFMILCRHNTCEQQSGKDRLWYLDKLCQKHSVKDALELVRWVEGYEAPALAVRTRIDDAANTVTLEIEAALERNNKTELAVLNSKLFEQFNGIGLTKGEIGDLIKACRVSKKKQKSKSSNLTTHHPELNDGKDSVRSSSDFDSQVLTVMNAIKDKHSASNDPSLFNRQDGTVVRLKSQGRKMPLLQTVRTEAQWQNELSGIASFIKVNSQGDEASVSPFRDIVRHIQGSMELPLETLDRVVGAPIFSKEGEVTSKKGYDQQTKCYISPHFEIRPAAQKPSEIKVREAVNLIESEALVDFPFSDAFDGSEFEALHDDPASHIINRNRGKASRAHAVAMMIQPFVRDMIDGPTPPYHIDKSTAGTGAGYLADVTSMVIDGRRCPAKPVSTNNEELRKSITAALRAHSSIIMLDNINHKLDSAELAGVLTAGEWRDRILNTSDEQTIEVRSLWIMTGNNVELSEELIRRAVPICLDAGTPDPGNDRTESHYKHPKLHNWLRDNRSNLVRACHTLVNNWVAKGKPHGKANLPSFEAWAVTMGGILETAGIEDCFLTNVANYKNHKGKNTSTDTIFIEALVNQEAIGLDTDFDAQSIYKKYFDPENPEEAARILPEVDFYKGSASAMTKIGIYLRKLTGKTFYVTLDEEPNKIKVRVHAGEHGSKSYYKIVERET